MAFFGICYSPYRTAEHPPNSSVKEADVHEDMRLIKAAGFDHIRTYGIDAGNQWNVVKAVENGINYLGVGVWVFPKDEQRTKDNIHGAVGQMDYTYKKYNRGFKCDLVVGNEVDRTDVATWTPQEIVGAMQHAKHILSEWPAGSPFLKTVRVTSCMSGTALQPGNQPDWKPVVQACDEVVYLTVYPWYGSGSPNNIDKQMQWSWENGLQQAAGLNKKVVIAEIGWPSAGGPSDRPVTSPANMKTNFDTTKTWVTNPNNNLKKTFDTFWFEMFDEPWKTAEGPWGVHWGLYNPNRTKK
jgi:exo-beta-1,3-glucanase (GH17 family)